MHPRTAETLLTGLALVSCLLFAVRANAGEGPCDLQAGIWAVPAEACRFSGAPAEAAKRFGGTALLELNRGFYRLEGATCGITSTTLAAKTYTLEVECSSAGTRYHGKFDVVVESAQHLRFGTRPDSPVYRYCADEKPSPQ